MLTLRGFQAGDSQPSSFGGELGFIDCADNGIAVPMGGTDGGVTGAGVVFPDGSCVLNATADVVTVKAEDGSKYIRGDTGGLVVLAHESKPTKNIGSWIPSG